LVAQNAAGFTHSSDETFGGDGSIYGGSSALVSTAVWWMDWHYAGCSIERFTWSAVQLAIGVVLLTSATFPLLALILMLPVASGFRGVVVVVFAPAAS
jgi:hypothetical protein